MTEAEGRSRLAGRVERRITEMAADYVDVAQWAGFSIETLAKIRRGLKVKASTYGKLEQGLGWARGSVEAIFRGGEPTVEARDGTLSPGAQLVDQIAATRASLVDEDDPVLVAVSAMFDRHSPERVADILDRVLAAYSPEERDVIWQRLLGKGDDAASGERGQRRAG